MKLVVRGLTVLICGVALVAGITIATTAAVAAPVAGASNGPSVVNSCSQSVTAGQYACFAMRRADLGFKPKTQFTPLAANPNLVPSGYGPASLQSAYSLPSATAGSGQRVYVVDAYNDPNAESDLAAYRTQYGLSPCTSANGCFQKLNQSGMANSYPSPNTGWAGEISLDLDMVSAICPNCGITLIEAKDASNNLFTAVKEAATLGAKFVSMSWGGPESSSDSTFDALDFKSSGVVYSVSTGDSAYTGGVEYPSSSPYAVAIGGTSLVTAANSRGWSESVWKTSSTEGTGSGCSAVAAEPSWQQNVVPAATCSRRAVADVSAVADPQTGVAVYQTYGGGGWTVYGGTSAAAPIIASTYALAGTPTATEKPGADPYARPASLNDVTTGNNGSCTQTLLCTAAVGWDGPTGLGTPNGVAAFTAGGITPPPPPHTVTVTNPGPQTGTVGAAASLQIQATDSAGAALTYSATGLPTGLTMNAGTGLISGTPSAAATFTVTVTAKDSTAATGSTSFSWVISPAAGGGCTGQVLKNPGFESGATSWAATAGVINNDGTYAHTGRGYAWLDGYGSRHTDTLAQTVTIPAGCRATLTYYLSINSADTSSTAHDTLKLTLATGGAPVQSFSNVNRSSGYVLETVDLSAQAGRSITLTWTGIEDSSLATNFWIDDAAVTLG
ncbi:MAG: putative Ig domain-containing protein [Actinomycetota bacterium]|nr:putative Ig domain-containing protein [Actinomycetota bacterium]